jgi:hypothetical protein
LRQVEQTAPQTREVLKKVEDDDLFAAFMWRVISSINKQHNKQLCNIQL